MTETKKRGRPKGSVGAYKEVKKTVQIAFRVTPEEKALISEEASRKNLSLSEYITSKLF